MTTHSSKSNLRAFTLIELLTVIAIIGILAGIIIPTVGAVKVSANKAKTKVQFSQWSAATELFKQEYGYYPTFLSNRVNGSVSATSTSIVNTDKLFQELLSGRGLGTGTPPAFVSAALSQNKKRLPFYSFSDSEITSRDAQDGFDGGVKDAFGNVEIAVYVDTNGDGFVNSNDATWTGVKANGEATATPDVPTGGVRAGVIFYSPGKGGSPASTAKAQLITSW
jgi:prepilin-type N-terminal cleavage/methylation domain-containing protein